MGWLWLAASAVKTIQARVALWSSAEEDLNISARTMSLSGVAWGCCHFSAVKPGRAGGPPLHIQFLFSMVSPFSTNACSQLRDAHHPLLWLSACSGWPTKPE